jgi:hypothetical protein
MAQASAHSIDCRERTDACPHVNRDDPRCASRFRLGRIEQAFAVCFGAYHACPMYFGINRDLAQARRAANPVVTVTISRHERDVLRATGT